MKKITAIICGVVLIAVVAVAMFFVLRASEDVSYVVAGDSNISEFRATYEALNNQPSPHNPNLAFQEIYIPNDNPVRFVNFDEIIHVLDSGTGVIYLGFPNCPWCRAMVSTLINVAMDFGAEIMYRNIFEDRNILELEDGEIVESRAGHPGYYLLLERLGDFAPAYTGLEDETIRRVFVPAVIFVRDGQILYYFEGLSTFRERAQEEAVGGWQNKTEAELEELRALFTDYFGQVFHNSDPIETQYEVDEDDGVCPIC